MSDDEIQQLDSRLVYENRWMKVREDRVRFPSGATGIYGIVEKPDFVVIAALDGEKIYLVEQYRYPVAGRYWELPQGSWESDAIEPAALALAELREETGLNAGSLTQVGYLNLAYGYSTQGYNIYVASGLTQGATDHDVEEEGLHARAFLVSEVIAMIANGSIRDATTVAAIGLLQIKGVLRDNAHGA